jgi:hypothetical protein
MARDGLRVKDMIHSVAEMQPYADRLDILDLFARYCHAVDRCDWGMLRSVFSDDVRADYSSVAEYTTEGVPVINGVEEFIKFLSVSMAPIGPGLTHFMSNHLIKMNGDTATAVVHNHVLNLPQGGVYHTHARRTPQGWRIDKLVFENRLFEDVSKRISARMREMGQVVGESPRAPAASES